VTIQVTAFATLAAFLPSPSCNGHAVLEIPDGSTLADVTRALGIPADLAVVGLVNGDGSEHGRPLCPGDVVTLFPPLVGG
jgi:sulfur carrier protein ThiS